MEDSSEGTVSLDGQETSERVQNTGTVSIAWPSLNAGGGWETGRVTRCTEAIVKLKS